MIITNPLTRGHTFIFDAEDGKPFAGDKYWSNGLRPLGVPAKGVRIVGGWAPFEYDDINAETRMFKFVNKPLMRFDELAGGIFEKRRQWLEEQTDAGHRICTVLMRAPAADSYNDKMALAFKMPDALGILFRMFWYDG